MGARVSSNKHQKKWGLNKWSLALLLPSFYNSWFPCLAAASFTHVVLRRRAACTNWQSSGQIHVPYTHTCRRIQTSSDLELCLWDPSLLTQRTVVEIATRLQVEQGQRIFPEFHNLWSSCCHTSSQTPMGLRASRKLRFLVAVQLGLKILPTVYFLLWHEAIIRLSLKMSAYNCTQFVFLELNQLEKSLYNYMEISQSLPARTAD